MLTWVLFSIVWSLLPGVNGHDISFQYLYWSSPWLVWSKENGKKLQYIGSKPKSQEVFCLSVQLFHGPVICHEKSVSDFVDSRKMWNGKAGLNQIQSGSKANPIDHKWQISTYCKRHSMWVICFKTSLEEQLRHIGTFNGK